MNRKQRIESILLPALKEWEVIVVDNSHKHSGHFNFDGTQESHFEINLINKSCKSINRIDVHRKINSFLKKEFLLGLHALEINITNN